MNDYHIFDCVAQSKLVVCAWGNHGAHAERAKQLVSALRENAHHAMTETAPLMCLGVNKTGQPKHPLYLRKDAALERLRTL